MTSTLNRLTIRDDLKAFALVRCHDIYRDYSRDEILRLPPSVQKAWEVGRDLAELEREHEQGRYQNAPKQ